MTPLNGTNPSLRSSGVSSQPRIAEAMGNQNLNKNTKNPYSSKPLPTVGKPVSKVGGPH